MILGLGFPLQDLGFMAGGSRAGGLGICVEGLGGCIGNLPRFRRITAKDKDQ